MPQNFIECDRDQELLLPPSMREWLPEDHLAWFVADAVQELDLASFYGAYRDDGWGRAAFEPQMMVALLLYAYAVGERGTHFQPQAEHSAPQKERAGTCRHSSPCARRESNSRPSA